MKTDALVMRAPVHPSSSQRSPALRSRVADGRGIANTKTIVRVILIGSAVARPAPSAAVENLEAQGRRVVQSLQEMRQAQVVRQKWDLSCGSAALSTLLTFHLGDPVSEADIITSILRRSDPVRIRARQGFSLLDLKRFAESRGHQADGYGRLNMQQLQRMGPAIVPTRIDGYDHFVVFRGVQDGRVVVADPAFGNRSMTVEQFEALWPRRIAFVVKRRDGRVVPSSLALTGNLAFPRVPASVVRQLIGERP